MQPSKRTTKLRLTIDLDVEPNGVPVSELLEILDYAASYLASNGLFSGETAAEVTEWRSTSEEVKGDDA